MPRPRLAVSSEQRREKGNHQGRTFPKPPKHQTFRSSGSQESSKARLMPSTSDAAGLGGWRAILSMELGLGWA